MKIFSNLIIYLVVLLGIPFSTEAKDFGSTYIKALFNSDYSPEQKQKAIEVITKRFSDYTNGKAVVNFINDSIIIKAPVIIDSVVCVDLLTTMGKLSVTESYSAEYLLPMLLKIDNLLANKKIDVNVFTEQLDSNHSLFSILEPNYNATSESTYHYAAVGFAQQADTAAINRILNNTKVKAHLPPDLMLLWSTNSISSYQGSGIYELVSVKLPQKTNPNYIDNSMILAAKLSVSQHYYSIDITLKDEYRERWEKLTARNINKALSIIIDNKVVTHPTVADTIRGGKFSISANHYDQTQAKALATILNGQMLVAKIKVIDVKHENAPIHYFLKLINKLK